MSGILVLSTSFIFYYIFEVKNYQQLTFLTYNMLNNPAKEESLETSESSRLTCSEAVDELFVTTFSSIKDTTSDAISKIRDFAGEVINFICINKPVRDWQILIARNRSALLNILKKKTWIFLITWIYGHN